MRSRSLLVGAVIALTATLIGALPAQAIVGGAESTRASTPEQSDGACWFDADVDPTARRNRTILARAEAGVSA